MNTTTTDIPNHDQLLDDPLYRRYEELSDDEERADDACNDDGYGDY